MVEIYDYEDMNIMKPQSQFNLGNRNPNRLYLSWKNQNNI